MSKSSYLTRLIALLGAFAMVTMVACGGDDDDTGAATGAGGTTSTANGGSTGTDQGQGGSTSASGGRGAAGSTAATCTQTTTCGGGAECSTATLKSSYGCVQACCTTADNKCGSSLKITAMFGGGTTPTCIAQAQLGNATSSCPTFTKAMADLFAAGDDAGTDTTGAEVGGLGIEYQGCCRTSDKTCGFLVTSLGLGCATATDIFNLVLGGFGDPTGTDTQTVTPKKCTP